MIPTDSADAWRNAEADTRDALNLMLAPDAPDAVFKILSKLRSATSAIQELECRTRGSSTTIG